MKTPLTLKLRTKVLLASFIPTLIVLSIVGSLFVDQFNRLVIQKQVDALLSIPTMLENTISSPEF